jgi:hypothetical protein
MREEGASMSQFKPEIALVVRHAMGKAKDRETLPG